MADGPTIEQFKGWAIRTAQSIAGPSHPLVDDMVQEALIEFWRAGGNPTMWKAARFRMIEIVTGAKQSFGGDPTPGPRYRADTFPVDWTDPITVSMLETALPGTAEYPEVVTAVRALPESDRELVYRRFWLGCPWPSKVDSSRWSKTVKPRLREALSASL